MLRFYVVLVFAGCANDPCSYESKCANDGPLTPQLEQALADACHARKSGACGAEYIDALVCQEANQVCNSIDTTDTTATVAAIQANCVTPTNAYGACCSSHPGDVACP